MTRFPIPLVLLAAGAAGAQSSGPTPVCWRARPITTCESWIVTEAALEMPAHSTMAPHLLVGSETEGYVSDDFETRLAFTVGLMANRGTNSALGVTVSTVNDAVPGRIEARYRRWLGPDHGLDLSAGFARGKVRGRYDPDELSTAGLTASFGVANTYIGGDARLDLMRAVDGRIIHGVYVTGRTGSRAAPIATATGFLLFLAAFSLLVGPNY